LPEPSRSRKSPSFSSRYASACMARV
jgi:hypothetical protein